MIRHAAYDDLTRIMEVFDTAKRYMRSEGNMDQWINGYPSIELLKEDISRENLYVMTDDTDRIYACFVLVFGKDPTYEKIYEGNWLNDESYATIHRIASDGTNKHILKTACEYAEDLIDNIRIDTHRDNKTMQGACLKNGFTKCGIIYIADGSERIAYHKIK